MSNSPWLQAQRSLLSRLNSDHSRHHLQHQQHSQRELQHIIQRDLEFLLNTKCPLPHQVNDLHWVKQSAIQFGMIDFMDINYASTEGKQQLGYCISQCIDTFEPRLQHCQVEVEDNTDFGAMLSIHISAEMFIQNRQNPIYFETLLQPEQALFTVKKGTFA